MEEVDARERRDHQNIRSVHTVTVETDACPVQAHVNMTVPVAIIKLRPNHGSRMHLSSYVSACTPHEAGHFKRAGATSYGTTGND